MNNRKTGGQANGVSHVVQAPRSEETPHTHRSVPLDRGIVSAATEIEDQDATRVLVSRYTTAQADLLYGAELSLAEAEEAAVQLQYDVAMSELNETDKKLAAEPLEIPATKSNGGNAGPGETEKETPFAKWQTRDQLSGALAATAIIGLLGASYAGIQATLADAGLPIFEEQKHLPFLLSMLAPAAGIMIKQATGVFNDPASKDRYRKAVTATGIVAFFIWIPAFASLFEGLSGVFDPFKETNHFVAWGFNVAHIVAEALISAALFFQLDALMAKYAPSDQVPNNARPPLVRLRESQVQTFEALALRLGEIKGRIRTLKAAYAEADVVGDIAVQQRMNRKPDDGLL